MAFRKRNVALRSSSDAPAQSTSQQNIPVHLPGTQPSPLDGRLTTSTGTSSLDDLLAGHAGLALGNSLLIEESGTTDYSGALLRCFAAEGLMQNHVVHLVGVPEMWTRELPGVASAGSSRSKKEPESGGPASSEKMKIAWRYERSIAGRELPTPVLNESASLGKPFCHTFDLARRLELPSDAKVTVHSLDVSGSRNSPFAPAIQGLQSSLKSSPPQVIHRLVVPTILSPALYPPHASEPQHVLQFVHSLRALLCQFPQNLVAMLTLPLELFPRTAGIVTWMEILADGVMELTPFPHRIDLPSGKIAGQSSSTEQFSSKSGLDEQPQGMFKAHKLPIFHERGGSSGRGVEKSLGEDLAFTMSRRRFLLRPFSLPPEIGDTEAQQGNAEDGSGKLSKDKIDF